MKKLLSWILLLGITAACIVGASAAEEKHIHCVCGGELDSPQHRICQSAEWKAVSSLGDWNAMTEKASLTNRIRFRDNTVSIYLTADVTLDARLEIDPGQTVNICLNGHTLLTKSGERFVEICAGTLNLCDCKGGGVLIGNNHPAVIYLYSQGTVNLYGGTVTTNASTSSLAFGLVYCSGEKIDKLDLPQAESHFTMYGGTLDASGLTMRDTTGAMGGALRSRSVNGTTTIYGGTIYGADIPEATGGFGGAISIEGSGASFCMTGGTVLGGSVSKGPGGCLYLGGDDHQISGGTIMGGNAVSGSGVYVKAGKTLTLSGAPVIFGNTGSNLFLGAGALLEADALQNSVPIGITMATPGIFLSHAVSGAESRFVSDSSQYAVASENGSLLLKKQFTYRIQNPMTMPDYSVPENCSTDVLRATAVRAMRDFLSIHWTPDKYYTYRNPYDAKEKQFCYETEQTYAGIPYTNAHTGIFQWYKYYDPETGVMAFPGDGMKWSSTLGSVCANTIIWSWSTVCNSLAGNYNSFNMTPMNHFLPVGDYKSPTDVSDFRNYSTKQICEENGKNVMLEAYAKVLPADALTSTSAGHAIMAISAAKVVRNSDGTVNGTKSTITIQDQRANVGKADSTFIEDGVQVQYTGRTQCVYSFDTLYNNSYIPITAAEFTGQKSYSPADASFTGSTGSLQELLAGEIRSNYLLCNLELFLTDSTGTSTRLALVHYNKRTSTGQCGAEGYSYSMAKLRSAGVENALEQYDLSGGGELRLIGQLSTGDSFCLAEVELEPECLTGDVNGDGEIDSLDGLLLMRYLNGWDVEIPCPDAMDANGDGNVDSLDGLLLMRFLNGWDVSLKQ